MALSKDKKGQIIEKLERSIDAQKIMLFVGISKLKTKDMLALKTGLREKGNVLTVAKKTLLHVAAKNKGLEIDTKKLDGELAVVFGNNDEVSAAGVVEKFSKKNENLSIIGGFFENQLIGKDKVVMLANIPSRAELLAKAVGSMQAPISGFVRVLNGNIEGLVRVLSKIKQ